MLYVPSAKRPEWIMLTLDGSWTGERTRSYHQAAIDARPQAVQRRERTSSLLVEQGEKLSQLKSIYSFQDNADTTDFLRTHPVLIDLLLEAATYLERYFGPSPQVVLEVVADPESDDSEELFASIQTSLSVDDALQRLHRFDQEWFLGQLHRVKGRLNFSLDFV